MSSTPTPAFRCPPHDRNGAALASQAQTASIMGLQLEVVTCTYVSSTCAYFTNGTSLATLTSDSKLCPVVGRSGAPALENRSYSYSKVVSRHPFAADFFSGDSTFLVAILLTVLLFFAWRMFGSRGARARSTADPRDS
ncbi:hypothetical protein C8F01DRAFT_1087637 [Mycena amicta]|nr:hypothetical protein C8F01DRAFT_1087637 [Mycena amicta]